MSMVVSEELQGAAFGITMSLTCVVASIVPILLGYSIQISGINFKNFLLMFEQENCFLNSNT